MPTCFDTSYKLGEFFQFIVAPYRFRANEFAGPRGYFGLVKHQAYPYGCVRAEDGTMFEVLRVAVPEGSPTGSINSMMILRTDLDGENLRYDMETAQRSSQPKRYVGSVEAGIATYRKHPEDVGADWEIRVTDETFSWKEEGILSLQGEFWSPGCQWLLPGPDFGTFYVNSFVEVKGEVLDKKVHGVICFDEFYMASEGAGLYWAKDIMVNNKGHVLWYMFGTRYDDGSAEWGQFIVGHDRMSFGFYANSDGECMTTTDNIHATVHDVEDKESPWTGRIDLTFDGEEWEFIPDPKGKMPELLLKEPPTPQQEGRWQHKGETRKPVAWFAWGETEKLHGLTQHSKLPTRE